MGMNWNYIRKGILYFLIALSLFLSWNIWTAGSQTEEGATTSGNGNPTVIFDRSLTSVFGPVQVAVHEGGNIRITGSEGMLTPLSENIVDWTLEGLSDPESISPTNFANQANQTASIVLVFEGLTPFALFDEIFSKLPADYEQRTFNRILIPIDNPSRVTFYNMESNLAYEAEVSGILPEIIDLLAYNEEQDYYSAELLAFGDRLHYMPAEEVEVAYMDYLIERLPNSLFIDRFFEDTSEVDVRRDGDVTRYIDLTSEMRINEKTNILTFNRQLSSRDPLALSSIAENSYRELLRVENWTQETHFHHYNRERNLATFRRYIDGWPVFGPNGEGALEISVTPNGLTYLRVPLTVVQTPIAPVEDSYSKTLESGRDLRMQLAEAGVDLDTVQNLRIGLTWRTSEESSRVVHFEPDWYLLIDGQWQRLHAVLNTKGGM